MKEIVSSILVVLLVLSAASMAQNDHAANVSGGEIRYDNVQIINAFNGSTIEGHDAVKHYFEQEKELLDTYGPSIIFQVYRINMQADTMEELQGKRLAEIKVDGDFVSGDDTVSAVREKVHALLERGNESEEGVGFNVTIENSEQMTFYFGGRPMRDDTLFYADNFVMLPAWVQVLLHNSTSEDLIQLITKLSDKGQGHPR
jgi:opacity protein-like surface antigen